MANPMKDWELTVIPAYGRDYETSAEAFDAWLADKDFYICTPGHPSYLNKSDAERFGVPNNTIRIRFKGKTEIFFVKYNPETRQWTKGGSTDDEELEEIEDVDME